MNAGPGGFAGAPVSKVLVTCSAGSSLALQLAKNWHKELPRSLSTTLHLLSYQGIGQVVCGVSLLYYWRLLERQWGSSKFGSYSCVVLVSTASLQQALAHTLGWAPAHGPTALVFANLASFAADVPATWQGSVLGANVSDKAIIWLASTQLLLGASRQTLAGAALGFAVGVAYRCNLFGLQRLRAPRAVVHWLSRWSSRLLSSSGSGGRRTAPTVPHGPPADSFDAAATRSQEATAPQLPPVSQQELSQLLEMGFDAASASRALQLSNNNIETALLHLT